MSKWNRPIRRINWSQRTLATYREKRDRQPAGPWSPVCGDDGIYLAGGSRVSIKNQMYDFGGSQLVRPNSEDGPVNDVSVIIEMRGGFATSFTLGAASGGVLWIDGAERVPENVYQINFVIASFANDIVGQDWLSCGDTTVIRRCFNQVRIVETCEGFEILQSASQI
jgi:hypothetical protein